PAGSHRGSGSLRSTVIRSTIRSFFFYPLSKTEVLYCVSFIDQLLERIYSDFQMQLHEAFSYFPVAVFSFHTFRNHGLIGYKQESTSWNFIFECTDEDGCRFHIDCHAAKLLQIFFKWLIIFPHPPVSSVYCSCPVIAVIIPDRSGYRFL